jgi:PhzF family phenazine biosynthesis protein
MKRTLWQVDAFATRPLEGNPAAIVPLDFWIAEYLMQKIANENNLAETAFFVRRAEGSYDLRWFTPKAEVDLCGHATLASAWLIFAELERERADVSFETRSGTLTVQRGRDGQHIMRLPADPVSPLVQDGLAQALGRALGAPPPQAIFKGRYLMAVWDDPAVIRGLNGPGAVAPVLRGVDCWGLTATAPGDQGYDFVSRFFAPDKGVPEDPVTGSAHCALTPFWAARLGKITLKARQVSPRGGDLLCTDEGAQTVLCGPCALYLRGEIAV